MSKKNLLKLRNLSYSPRKAAKIGTFQERATLYILFECMTALDCADTPEEFLNRMQSAINMFQSEYAIENELYKKATDSELLAFNENSVCLTAEELSLYF